jgi:hypothetical protein
MISVVNIFLTQQFQRKKHVRQWLKSSFQPKGTWFNLFSIVLPINKMNEKIYI